MNIYLWYEPRYNAVKLGMGINPQERMRDYARQYNLQPKYGTLRTFTPPTGHDVGYIERRCHDALVNMGLTRIKIPCVDSDGASRELFRLREITYEAVVAKVEQLVPKQPPEPKPAPQVDWHDAAVRQAEALKVLRIARERAVDAEHQAELVRANREREEWTRREEEVRDRLAKFQAAKLEQEFKAACKAQPSWWQRLLWQL